MYKGLQLTILVLSYVMAIGHANLYSQQNENDVNKVSLPEHFVLDNKEQFHELEKSIEFANHIIECVKNKNVETIPTFGEKYQMRGTSVECKLHYNLKTRSHEVMLQEVTITIPSGGTNKKMSPFVLIQFYPHSFQPAFIKQYKLFSENALHIDLYKNGHFKNLSVGNVVGDDVPKIINRKESKKDIDAVQNEQLLEKNKTGKLAIYRWDEQGQLIQSAAHSYSTEDDLFHKIFPNGVILKK